MIFNSHAFLLLFLPIAFTGYLVASRGPIVMSVAWLVLCSLAFYGFWNPAFLVLLIGSILFNYLSGHLIGNSDERSKNLVFIFAVAANLTLLGFFKYLGPLLDFASEYGMLKSPTALHVILPLGISFFTFTQIGYLVDRRDGLATDLGFLRYMLFVTFFPHLIAGPILHVREIGAQLLDGETYKPKLAKIAPGLSLFALGLAKKVLIADPLAAGVALGFARPAELGFVTGWATAIAYTMQLYFDFSGYSDMAIGLAGMFGMRFPANFNSPYKSRGMIEFWQRWHMTLSRYLQLLLYNPISLAITRRRVAKGLKVSHKALKSPSAFASLVVVPTFITMGLAGIWHGAGLQFLVFGLLFAFYLIINHAARVYGHGTVARTEKASLLEISWKVCLTFIAVVVALVFFRANSCTDAVQILYSMVGGHGGGVPETIVSALHLPGLLTQILTEKVPLHLPIQDLVFRILVCFVLVWSMPNSQQILGNFSPTLEPSVQARWSLLRWQPNYLWAISIGLLLWTSIMSLNQSTTFLYFQF